LTEVLRAETILGFPIRKDRWNVVCEISPEQAKSILEIQPSQRPVSQAHVNALVEEIVAKRFVRSNEGIAFDEHGHLFDGQHRLWAVFESGFPIEALCCFGEPRSNFDRIGTVVRRRTTSDHLVMEGVVSDPNTGNLIGSAGRFLWSYDKNLNPTQASLQKGWSNDAMRDVIAAHPDLLWFSHELRGVRMLFPRSATVALFTLMKEADPQKAMLFLSQVLHGEGLSSGDPALTLRNSSASTYIKRGMRVEAAYKIVRAWNAFYDGRQIFKLYGSNSAGAVVSVRKGGLDPFPRISGLHMKRKDSQRKFSLSPSKIKSACSLVDAGAMA